MRNKIKIAPSILSADLSRVGEQVAEAAEAGADYIHIDVMDGHFVPNITIGPSVVSAIRPRTSLPLDVHLMIEYPERYISQFAQAGSDIITIHVEACTHLHRTVESIKDANCRAGVSLNPGTPLTDIDEILPFVDLVLVMSVNPGFGGQRFIESSTGKIARLRSRLNEMKRPIELEVDGGINAETAPRAVRAGADVLVAGAAIFSKKESVARALASIRESLRELETV